LLFDPADVRKITLARIDAIFYGVLISIALIRFETILKCRHILFLCGIISVLFCIHTNNQAISTQEKINHYRMALLILPIGFSLMLPLAFTFKNLPRAAGFLTDAIKSISLWSYSIYLSHIPILFSIYAIFGDARKNTILNFSSKIVGLVACIFVSRFIYTKFEFRLTNRRPKDGAGS
jgi:peptidoglycan/LPS O-acetylase OafA/YrhL